MNFWIRVFLLGTLFFQATLSIGQTSEIDSLKGVLHTQISDEKKVDIYVDLAGEFENSDSALYYAQLAYELGKSLNYDSGVLWGLFKAGEEYLLMNDLDLADSVFSFLLDESNRRQSTEGQGLGLSGLGTLHYFKGEIEISMSMVDSALHFLEESENESLLASMLEMQGKNYLRLGDFDASMEFILKAQQAYEDIGDQSGIQDTNNLLGVIYDEKGDQSRALEFFLKATGGNLETAPLPVINNIANINQNMGNYDTAAFYHRKSLSLARSQGATRDEIVSLLNLGFTLHDLEQLDQALKYHLQAITLFENYEDPLWEGRAHDSAGLSYRLLMKYDSALKHFERAITIMTKFEDYVGLVETYHNQARCLQEIDRLEEARNAALKLISIAQDIEYPRGLMIGSAVLSEVESEMGNFEAAYNAQMRHEEMYDSLYDNQQTQEIARLQAEFDFQRERDSVAFAQKEAQLTFDRELEKKQTALLGAVAGGLLILTILGLLYRSYRTKQKANLELTRINELVGLKNSELTRKNTEISELRVTEKQMAEESLAMKERELTTITMLSHEKNSILQQLGEHVGSLTRKVDDRVIPDLEEIKKIIKSNLSEESWSTFMLQFEKVHPRFFAELKERWPKLTQYDLRLCAHLKVGMDNKEIAQVSAISVESVKKSTNRLKKKMDLGPEISLRDFMIKFK